MFKLNEFATNIFNLQEWQQNPRNCKTLFQKIFIVFGWSQEWLSYTGLAVAYMTS